MGIYASLFDNKIFEKKSLMDTGIHGKKVMETGVHDRNRIENQKIQEINNKTGKSLHIVSGYSMTLRFKAIINFCRQYIFQNSKTLFDKQ